MIKLKYGNTNTFYIQGDQGGLLVDTDLAGTLPAFYQAIKRNGIRVRDISYVVATHYHPDHIGLVSELMEQGVKLLLIDTQAAHVHDVDYIFRRDGHLAYRPIQEAHALQIRCQESRDFLASLGIAGQIIATPSHSDDSVSVILDTGVCMVGDLEPLEYLDAYGSNRALAQDWQAIMRHRPKAIYYAHANEKIIAAQRQDKRKDKHRGR